MQNALHNQRLFGWTNLRLGHTYWVSPESYQRGKVCWVNLEYISNEVIYVKSVLRLGGVVVWRLGYKSQFRGFAIWSSHGSVLLF